MSPLSRRSFLSGAATVGGVSTFAGLRHTSTASAHADDEDTQDARPRPPFDIRDLVSDPEFDEKSTQCIYDTLNLTIFLIGDIPFRELFTLSLRVLIPRVFPRLRHAAHFGLIAHPDRVERLALKLLSEAPAFTVGDLFVRARTEIPRETFKTVARLRREGIRIPLPVADGLTPDVSQQRSDALQGLLHAAPNFTFKDLFVVSRETADVGVVNAVQVVTAAGLFAWFKNDRCCETVDGVDRCVDHDGSWCSLTPTRGCSLRSDLCPRHGGT